MSTVEIIPGAEPFLLPGNRRGVLLVHGFTGSPAEMHLLGKHLHALGYTVLAIRLPGHATHILDMEPTNWHHWYGSLIDGWHFLRNLCDEINVIGLSMGGLLSLKLAAEYPVDRVASLSTPVFLANKQIRWLPFYRLFRRFVQKKQRDYDIDPRFFVGYDAIPLTGLSELLQLIELVTINDLPLIQCPVLLVQSRREKTVLPESAPYLLECIGTPRKEIFWLEKSGHMVTVDIERELVFAKIASFLEQPINQE